MCPKQTSHFSPVRRWLNQSQQGHSRQAYHRGMTCSGELQAVFKAGVTKQAEVTGARQDLSPPRSLSRGKAGLTSRSRGGAHQQQGCTNNIGTVSITTQDMSASTLCNTPSNFYVGKVATYWTNWLSLTSDAAILNTIKGVEIDFMTDYLNWSSPPKIPFSKANSLKVD